MWGCAVVKIYDDQCIKFHSYSFALSSKHIGDTAASLVKVVWVAAIGAAVLIAVLLYTFVKCKPCQRAWRARQERKNSALSMDDLSS